MEHMYWMWPKRKFSGGSHDSALTISSPSHNDSWEEQAFAEDSAAGALGGCIWPPRSYTCSFCRREFRSAQALGGHMNVHRRDRARLKQSPNSHQFPSTTYPGAMAYSPNPNPNGDMVPLSPRRVSAVPTIQDNYSDQAFFSPLPTLFDRGVGVLGLKRGRENSRIAEKGCRADISYDSTVKSCDSIVQQSLEMDEEEKEMINCKRKKRDDGTHLFFQSDISEKRRSDDALLPFFIKTSSGERHHQQSEVTGVRAAAMDDLDLELRLGDPPKEPPQMRHGLERDCNRPYYLQKQTGLECFQESYCTPAW